MYMYKTVHIYCLTIKLLIILDINHFYVALKQIYSVTRICFDVTSTVELSYANITKVGGIYEIYIYI